MAEYSVSQATRLSLINTAGALFATHGIDELESRAATTTRAIAKAANENTGTIHYHFGGREDLLNAVIDYALQPWQDDPLGSYVKRNSSLLETPEGQARLVEELIELFFAPIVSPAYPSWCASLLFQVTQRKLKVTEKVFETCSKPMENAFATIYKKATNDDDDERAHAWAFMVVTPIIFNAITIDRAKVFFKRERLSENYLETLKSLVKRSALSTLRIENVKQERGQVK
jgi:AcrR family transcriptional regulator